MTSDGSQLAHALRTLSYLDVLPRTRICCITRKIVGVKLTIPSSPWITLDIVLLKVSSRSSCCAVCRAEYLNCNATHETRGHPDFFSIAATVRPAVAQILNPTFTVTVETIHDISGPPNQVVFFVIQDCTKLVYFTSWDHPRGYNGRLFPL